ncbi:apoptosis-antagonizing transcription factor [Xylaria sp. FL1777]|nr:apoptosis-antagonizing transcription factor [Xylaria sp. FL1777]
MGKKHGRARELADLVERPVKDFDPEADVVPSDSDRSGDESSDNEPAGTEHYVAVGKSKLRRQEPLSLGPKYRGTRVSREALEADDDDAEDDDDGDEEGEATDDDDASSDYEDARERFDDPDTADLEADQQGQEDVEIDSDEVVGETDWEQFKRFANGRSKSTSKENGHTKRPTAADFMESDDEDEDKDINGDENDDTDVNEGSSDDLETGFIDDEVEESDEDEPSLSDEEDGLSDAYSEDGSEDDESNDDEGENDEDEGEQTSDGKKSKRSNGSTITASIKEMMGEQTVVKSLLKTVDADVRKGRAVQRQRKGFDALLNLRIRLQKSIVAINSLNYVDEPEDQTAEPYEAAERSALQLWNALDDFRMSIHKGKKRKHAETDDISTMTLWNRMEVHEKHQAARRKQVLEKWSRDAKKTSITASSAQNKFTSKAEKPITAMLSAELDAPERLIKRTRTPRSCAPCQAAQKINEDDSIYDDADFYQLLLKELVDQRSGDGSGTGLQAATIRYAAAKEAKAKRHVDTKASKGRKMRFAPIPKLQNFMAPEDRRAWEQSAIDRFFGTLFGQKMALTEESSDEEMGGISVEEQGIRLFRN